MPVVPSATPSFQFASQRWVAEELAAHPHKPFAIQHFSAPGPSPVRLQAPPRIPRSSFRGHYGLSADSHDFRPFWNWNQNRIVLSARSTLRRETRARLRPPRNWHRRQASVLASSTASSAAKPASTGCVNKRKLLWSDRTCQKQCAAITRSKAAPPLSDDVSRLQTPRHIAVFTLTAWNDLARRATVSPSISLHKK